MDTPVWKLMKNGEEVWSTHERDYLTAVEDALKSQGCELVRVDLETCAGCGLPNGMCLCQRCDTCG